MSHVQSELLTNKQSKSTRIAFIKRIYYSEITRFRIPIITGVILIFFAIIEFIISRIETNQTHIYGLWFGRWDVVSFLLQDAQVHFVNSVILLLIAILLFYLAYRYNKKYM